MFEVIHKIIYDQPVLWLRWDQMHLSSLKNRWLNGLCRCWKLLFVVKFGIHGHFSYTLACKYCRKLKICKCAWAGCRLKEDWAHGRDQGAFFDHYNLFCLLTVNSMWMVLNHGISHDLCSYVQWVTRLRSHLRCNLKSCRLAETAGWFHCVIQYCKLFMWIH